MNKILKYVFVWIIPFILMCVCGYNYGKSTWIYFFATEKELRLDGYAYLLTGMFYTVLFIFVSVLAIALTVYLARKDYINRRNALGLLDKHDKGKMKDAAFLKKFGNVQVFYSTPFGDHKDGGQKLFLLPGPEQTAYLPVFCSQEHVYEFYENAGRVGYMIMQGTFTSVLETTRSINDSAPIKMGIIIEPKYYKVTVDVADLDTVINMTK